MLNYLGIYCILHHSKHSFIKYIWSGVSQTQVKYALGYKDSVGSPFGKCWCQEILSMAFEKSQCLSPFQLCFDGHRVTGTKIEVEWVSRLQLCILSVAGYFAFLSSQSSSLRGSTLSVVSLSEASASLGRPPWSGSGCSSFWRSLTLITSQRQSHSLITSQRQCPSLITSQSQRHSGLSHQVGVLPSHVVRRRVSTARWGFEKDSIHIAFIVVSIYSLYVSSGTVYC